MKLTDEDVTILRAALSYLLDGEEDAWEDLMPDEVERAHELLSKMDSLVPLGDDGDDDEDVEDEDSDY